MYHLDHLVHFVKSPEDARSFFQQQGLLVEMGGQHKNWGTYNSIASFGIPYIEFIGINNREKFDEAAQKPYTLHETYKIGNEQSGLMRVAIQTTTIEEDAKKLREAGFEVFGPETFSRMKEDGTELFWQLLHVGEKENEIDYPFFIQWHEESRHTQALPEHPFGKLKLASVTYQVPDLLVFDVLNRILNIEMTLTYDDLQEVDIGTVHLNGTDVHFVVTDQYRNPYAIQSVTITGATEAKIVQYEGATYHFTK